MQRCLVRLGQVRFFCYCQHNLCSFCIILVFNVYISDLYRQHTLFKHIGKCLILRNLTHLSKTIFYSSNNFCHSISIVCYYLIRYFTSFTAVIPLSSIFTSLASADLLKTLRVHLIQFYSLTKLYNFSRKLSEQLIITPAFSLNDINSKYQI